MGLSNEGKIWLSLVAICVVSSVVVSAVVDWPTTQNAPWAKPTTTTAFTGEATFKILLPGLAVIFLHAFLAHVLNPVFLADIFEERSDSSSIKEVSKSAATSNESDPEPTEHRDFAAHSFFSLNVHTTPLLATIDVTRWRRRLRANAWLPGRANYIQPRR